MKTMNKWLLAIAGAFAMILGGFTVGGNSDAGARGGGRRGGGGGSRGGGGISRRGGGSSGRGSRNNERKEAQALARREDRQARVETARLIYAQRERQSLWDAEATKRLALALHQVLGSATD